MPKAIEPAVVGIQRPEDLAPQYADPGGFASRPALVRAIPHCAQAELLDLA
jgi:hypothetical protein